MRYKNYKSQADYRYRTSSFQSIGDSMSQFLKINSLDVKFKETYIIANWERMMGKTISSRTESVYIKNKTLFVKTKSAPLKQQLLYAKSSMLDIIHQELGSEILTEVVIL